MVKWWVLFYMAKNVFKDLERRRLSGLSRWALNAITSEKGRGRFYTQIHRKESDKKMDQREM